MVKNTNVFERIAGFLRAKADHVQITDVNLFLKSNESDLITVVLL